MKSIILKKLSEIEVDLTPKEWAIRLADEIRRYPSEKEFLRALAEGSYWEWPYIKPFLMLSDQAELRCPETKPEYERARRQKSRDLRMEFQALKYLINSIGREVESQAKINGLNICALATDLQGMIFRKAVATTLANAAAWITQHRGVTARIEATLIQTELHNLEVAAGSQALFLAMAEEWADRVAGLVMTIFARKDALVLVEKRFFDGHAILSREVEAAAEENIQLILKVVATFNEYVVAVGEGSGQVAVEGSGGSLTIDAEKIRREISTDTLDSKIDEWVTEARDQATANLLQEDDQHSDFIWRRFREKVAANF